MELLAVTYCRFHPGLRLWLLQMVIGSAAIGASPLERI